MTTLDDIDDTRLGAVQVALTGVARSARTLAGLDGISGAHELAQADLDNLRRSIDDLDRHTGLTELWAVFVFSHRLCGPNTLPGVSGGAATRVVATRPPGHNWDPRRRREHLRRRRNLERTLDTLAGAVNATTRAIDRHEEQR